MYEGIVSIFREIPDPRKGNAIVYDLVEVLIISILAILCGAEYFTEMELFGHERERWLRTLLKLEHGIPSHDTFCDVYSALDPETITKSFSRWVETIRQKISGEVIAIDGKTICASRDVPKNKKAVHIVSAWAAANRLVLGQLACAEKSNEITAIPQLLDWLEIKGCIVSIDAMGTQTKIAEKIVEKGADYILSVKENQPRLYSDIALYFETERKNLMETAKTAEKSHGRYETREMAISNDVAWLDPEGSGQSCPV
jgi:predicted transposase YbfD/YdcC